MPWLAHRSEVRGLGDVRSSTMERLQREYGNESMTQESTRSSRARQMARGIISMAAGGHKVILALLDTDHLGPVSSWLERAGARIRAVADASDIESNRESLNADIKLGLQKDKTAEELYVVLPGEKIPGPESKVPG
eukprot:Skav200800  [mRNA]  locus=scaffold959:150961:160814:+ [translate_table: standard]